LWVEMTFAVPLPERLKFCVVSKGGLGQQAPPPRHPPSPCALNSLLLTRPEPEFVNNEGAQESIP
jgi:hypothetical protein